MGEVIKLFCANCGKQIRPVSWFDNTPKWSHEDGMLGCRALKALYACIIQEDV